MNAQEKFAAVLRDSLTDIRFVTPEGKVEANYDAWAKEGIRIGETPLWALTWIRSGYPEVPVWMQHIPSMLELQEVPIKRFLYTEPLSDEEVTQW